MQHFLTSLDVTKQVNKYSHKAYAYRIDDKENTKIRHENDRRQL